MRLGNRRENIKGVTYFECEIIIYLGPTVLAKTFPIERFFSIWRMLLVMDLIICAVQVVQCSLKMVNRLKNIGIVYQL